MRMRARPIGLQPVGRDSPQGNEIESQIARWIDELGTPLSRKYLVVGRTDDLKYNAKLADNRTYNNALATRRRDAAVAKLKAAGLIDSEIVAWIETQAPPPLPSELDGISLPERFTLTGRLALPSANVKAPTGKTRPVWNKLWTQDGDTAAQHALARDDERRIGYRCADIYAIDAVTTPTPPPPPPPGDDVVPTRILVPGPDGPPPPRIPSTGVKPAQTDYRVRLRAKWDSPTVVNTADMIPDGVRIPLRMEGSADRTAGDLDERRRARIDHDPEAHRPRFLGADPAPRLRRADRADPARRIAEPARRGDAVPQRPARRRARLRPGVHGADRSGRRAGGLQRRCRREARRSRRVARRRRDRRRSAQQRRRARRAPSTSTSSRSAIAGTAVRASAQRSITPSICRSMSICPATAPCAAISSCATRAWACASISAKSGLASVGITYDDLSVEVADPGQWSLGGPLGNLIRIAASRIGNGSTWMELDLEFALDLGVVRLEGATIRITLDPFSVELRGLTAVIVVPGVIKGKGSVTVGSAGAIRALLGVKVIPAKLGAYGALAIDQDFVSVEVGIQFPVGIPLANTGLGLFGLMGRFVANGTRNLDGLANPDPVAARARLVRPPAGAEICAQVGPVRARRSAR